jgi:tetratricopeptide (TPR) repeat protein
MARPPRGLVANGTLWLLLLLVGAGAVLAAGERDEETLREGTWQALSEVQAALDDGREAAAAAMLDALLPRTRSHPFEYAVVRQAQGYLRLQQERPQDALAAFREALASGKLPERVIAGIRVQIARTFLLLERPEEAIAAIDLIPASELEAGTRVLKGQALLLADRHEAALAEISAAIKSSREPPLEWQELLLAAQLGARQLAPASVVLKSLIEARPSRLDWWRQLAAIYQHLGAHRAASAVLAAAHRLAPLEGEVLLELVRLQLHAGQPASAATLMEDAWQTARLRRNEETLRLYIDACVLAREPARAISTLEQINAEGASMALHAQLGRLHFRVENWQDSWRHFARALEAGEAGERAAEDALLAGIAALRAGNTGVAREMLQRARSFPDTRERAARWLARLADAA